MDTLRRDILAAADGTADIAFSVLYEQMLVAHFGRVSTGKVKKAVKGLVREKKLTREKTWWNAALDTHERIQSRTQLNHESAGSTSLVQSLGTASVIDPTYVSHSSAPHAIPRARGHRAREHEDEHCGELVPHRGKARCPPRTESALATDRLSRAGSRKPRSGTNSRAALAPA